MYWQILHKRLAYVNLPYNSDWRRVVTASDEGKKLISALNDFMRAGVLAAIQQKDGTSGTLAAGKIDYQFIGRDSDRLEQTSTTITSPVRRVRSPMGKVCYFDR